MLILSHDFYLADKSLISCGAVLLKYIFLRTKYLMLNHLAV